MSAKKSERIIRVKERRQFLTVSKAATLDPRFSLEMLGLYYKLMSKPDDWLVMFGPLARELGCGEKRVRAVFNQLQDVGYALRRCVRDRRHATVKRWELLIFETMELCQAARADVGNLHEIFEYPHFQRNNPDGRNPPCGLPTMWDAHMVESPPCGKRPTTELTTYRSKELTETTTDGCSDAPAMVVEIASVAVLEPPPSLDASPETSVVVVPLHEAGEEGDALLLLRSVGVNEPEKLVQRAESEPAGDVSIERVRMVLAHAMTRDPPHRRGFACKAMVEGWDLAPINTERISEAAVRARAEQNRAADEARASELNAEKLRVDRVVDALSETQWEEQVRALIPRLGTKSRADIERDGGRSNRLVRQFVFEAIEKKRAN